jgi:hypothetical protein
MSKVFPASPIANYPFDLEAEWMTIVSPFDGGNEQRRRKIQFPRYNMTLTWNNLTAAEMATLWNFYNSCSGAYETVYYVLPWIETFTGLYVNTGDGSATIFDLPGVSTSSRAIYLNGTVQGGGFSYLPGGGVANADRVSFTGAPAAGVVITADFTGYFRNKCRFKNDRMSRRLFEVLSFSTGVEMKGLSGA